MAKQCNLSTGYDFQKTAKKTKKKENGPSSVKSTPRSSGIMGGEVWRPDLLRRSSTRRKTALNIRVRNLSYSTDNIFLQKKQKTYKLQNDLSQLSFFCIITIFKSTVMVNMEIRLIFIAVVSWSPRCTSLCLSLRPGSGLRLCSGWTGWMWLIELITF